VVDIKVKSDENVFDYEKFARKNKINKKELNSIVKEVYEEFPNDKMLAELHIIRALKKFKDSE